MPGSSNDRLHDLERSLDRDYDREPTLGQRPRVQLDERGAVRVFFFALKQKGGGK